MTNGSTSSTTPTRFDSDFLIKNRESISQSMFVITRGLTFSIAPTSFDTDFFFKRDQTVTSFRRIKILRRFFFNRF